MQVLLPPLVIYGITADGSQMGQWALSYPSKWLYLRSPALNL